MTDRALKVTRGDATMLYATSHGSYTIRFHLRLDRSIDGQKMRVALDKTAQRYPYLCVSLKRNGREYYYEANNDPVSLFHTSDAVTLGAPETNGHVWAACYQDDNLYIDFFHGRSDGTGAYSLITTLLYYYFDEQGIPGIKTLDTPVSVAETHDPVDDLPLVDLSKLDLPTPPKALSLMEASGLEHVNGKGLILKLMIPEEPFMRFTKSHDGTPGVLLTVLVARAIERIHQRHEEPLVSNYIVNVRPMLKANESFHNSGSFPLFEISAVNGRIFVSVLQPFAERLYYDALLEELKDNGIPYVDCGTTPVSVAEIRVLE